MAKKTKAKKTKASKPTKSEKPKAEKAEAKLAPAPVAAATAHPFGAKLQAMIEATGTVYAFSKEHKFDYPWLRKILKGQNLTVANLLKILDCMGKKVGDLA